MSHASDTSERKTGRDRNNLQRDFSQRVPEGSRQARDGRAHGANWFHI